MLANPATFAQKSCQLNLVGTWVTPDRTSPTLYRFERDGTVRALAPSGSEFKEIANAAYKLDNPKAPKSIVLSEISGQGRRFPLTAAALEITAYDDTSLMLNVPGHGAVRWTRVDPHRYFLVLAGRIKTFYDGSGPTFPMLIKSDGSQVQIDAVGIYARKDGYWKFGSIPAETYKQFMKESEDKNDVMLRLEINETQYERALKTVRSWERRAREGTLLYPEEPMDNILLAKQITEDLNQCAESIKLYHLDWTLNDKISTASRRDDNPISRIPFLYFKELRRLNETLHVPDEKFNTALWAAGQEQGRLRK